MKKRITKSLSDLFLWVIIGVLLSACGNQGEPISSIPLGPTIIFTPSPIPIKPTFTPTNTIAPSPTSTRTHTPTLAPTYTPLPTRTPPIIHPPEKNVLLDYSISGAHGFFDIYVDGGSSRSSRLVLYTDGQMIIPGQTYKQKILSTDEINQFLSQLEPLGFYALETNQQHDLTDRLYDFGDQYQRIYDGTYYCVLVTGDRERNICAHEPQSAFLVPQMKNVLGFLDSYQPQGMTPYEPDRILLLVMVGRSEFEKGLTATLWPDHLPSIETPDEKFMYIEGETAKEIYALYENGYSIVVLQNDIEYTIYLEIVLPHKAVEQP